MTELEQIPGPVGLPFLGNVNTVDPMDSVASLERLTEIYGPIFKLNIGGSGRIFIASHALLDEICDEKRFEKQVAGALFHLRDGVRDALFTAYPGEENWEIAHRVLMPAFGPLSIQSMFDEMHDIASQLVIKWARFGPKERIDAAADFTRLTLDSIALCAMGFRFNSFYHEDMHPFVDSMVTFLLEAGIRAQTPAVFDYFRRSAHQKYDEDIDYLRTVARSVLEDRRKNPSDKKDLLNAMINGRDPKTGKGLDDQNILDNMITFLVAGHETTSGLLSFLFYYLLKYPATYQKAQREVDEVVGRGPVKVEHMSKLPYIEACLREALRLNPSAPTFTVQPIQKNNTESPVTLGGKYEVKMTDGITSLTRCAQMDPAVYGDDADQWRPERMLDEEFYKLPQNAWKPFGNGMRGCIGRPFAWQESILIVTMLLQTFNFRFEDPSYNLVVKQTLTVKPKGLFMHATLRDHIDPIYLERMLHGDTSKEGKTSGHKSSATDLAAPGKAAGSKKPKSPMTILYGSNAGTCESLAQSLARTAASRNFEAEVMPLDAAVDKLPKDQPVIVICPSYEGQPPDNATHFVEWLENLKGGDRLKGVKYAVYGVGNHDWVSTFHRIPKLLNAGLEKHGATKIIDIGVVDVAAGNIFSDFDNWQDEQLWPVLGGDVDEAGEPGLEVEIDTSSRRTKLRQDVKEAVVISNELLTAPNDPEKRHITLKMPEDMNYRVGDYLAVLPVNNPTNIHRVLKHYGIPWDAVLNIKAGANTTIPTGHPVSANDVLGAYVELSQPATRKNVARIAASATEPKERAKIEALGGDNFDEEVVMKRRSPLDILEEFPSAALSLGEFLAMLPPMRIRQYSISSSPLVDPTVATLTWAVLDTTAKAADSKRFLGVASNYLSSVEEGDRVQVAVKPSKGNFRLPSDIGKTPIIMMCAGSGLAPFRGFVQERATQMQAGRKLAPAHLLIGCAHPDKDMLFKEDLKKWEKQGVVKVYYAFSQAPERSKGCRHVQDRLWAEREEMKKQFEAGAQFYVCGSSGVGEGCAEVVKKIFREAAETAGKPKTQEEIHQWFEGIRKDRFSSDVFV